MCIAKYIDFMPRTHSSTVIRYTNKNCIYVSRKSRIHMQFWSEFGISACLLLVKNIQKID